LIIINVIKSNRPKDDTRTRELWKDFTNQPYDLDLIKDDNVKDETFTVVDEIDKIVFGYDLVSACKRQAAFYYQVSLLSLFLFALKVRRAISK